MEKALTYQVRTFDLSGVQGLSKKAIDLHLGLYKTYVETLNKLLEQSPQRPGAAATTAAAASPLALDGYNRRFAFEYNGVALHELFFEQLAGKRRQLPGDGDFAEALHEEHGDFAGWKASIESLAKTRGVGWVLTLREHGKERLHNCWIDLHHLSRDAEADRHLLQRCWRSSWRCWSALGTSAYTSVFMLVYCSRGEARRSRRPAATISQTGVPGPIVANSISSSAEDDRVGDQHAAIAEAVRIFGIRNLRAHGRGRLRHDQQARLDRRVAQARPGRAAAAGTARRRCRAGEEAAADGAAKVRMRNRPAAAGEIRVCARMQAVARRAAQARSPAGPGSRRCPAYARRRSPARRTAARCRSRTGSGRRRRAA
jgi:Fe-Mn family superoxide dismutase